MRSKINRRLLLYRKLYEVSEFNSVIFLDAPTCWGRAPVKTLPNKFGHPDLRILPNYLFNLHLW